MKSKKFTKKLAFNRQTISDLNASEQGNVRGGIYTGYTCPGYCNTDMSCGPTECTACLTNWNCSNIVCSTPYVVCAPR